MIISGWDSMRFVDLLLLFRDDPWRTNPWSNVRNADKHPHPQHFHHHHHQKSLATWAGCQTSEVGQEDLTYERAMDRTYQWWLSWRWRWWWFWWWWHWRWGWDWGRKLHWWWWGCCKGYQNYDDCHCDGDENDEDCWTYWMRRAA